MIPRRVRWATLLAFLLHGVFILTGQYGRSFDAFTHQFFADHYRLDWWTLWEPRWYTGFSIVSYPPLVHQLMGLLSHLTGLDAAFALVMWAALTAYPLGVYAFSRSFLGRNVSCYAAFGAAMTPSLLLAAHVFGQIPTVVATLAALFALAALANFLRQGGWLNAALAVSLFTVVMAAHHATLMFLPWVVAGLLLHMLLNEKVPRGSLFTRLAIFTPLAIFFGLAVIWPFWDWGRTQEIQTPIDHLTRHNYLTSLYALAIFFLPAYGALIPLIPFALWLGRFRRYSGLSLAFLPLFILGLGGTTPLPLLLFGKGWEWLIYDRFAFWAALLLLPFMGVAIVLTKQRLRKKNRSTDFESTNGKTKTIHHEDTKTQNFFSRKTFKSWCLRGFVVKLFRQRWESQVFLIVMGLVALLIGFWTNIFPFEPARVEMQPIVNFLAQGDHARWRYLTFGFGDQLARLSTLTSATTIDGNYHTARNLPELRTSGIGQIDTVFWMEDGMAKLDPILQKSGERGVRWGFINRPEYIAVLRRNGWTKLQTLENGIEVWENPSAILPPPVQIPPQDPFAAFSWGVFPLFSLAVAGVLSVLWLLKKNNQIESFFGSIHKLALGLLPVSLCFWYYQPILRHPIEKVYFTYSDGLLFLSDALALVAVLAWLIILTTKTQKHKEFLNSPLKLRVFVPLWFKNVENLALAFCLLASLSAFWAVDWQVAIFVSLHGWLTFGVFLAVSRQPESWRVLSIGFCAALAVQIVLGGGQFFAQSTAFLAPLHLEWPSAIEPLMRGASVVELADGTRLLRVYGSLPHPNLLGGLTLMFLGGPMAFFFAGGKKRPLWALGLLTGGAALLLLTFSRSAWLGLAAAGCVLLLQQRQLSRQRMLAAGAAVLTGLLTAAVPLQRFLFTRAGAGSVTTEEFSNTSRFWLMGQALNIIKDHPFLGVGVGNFMLEYARRAPLGYLLEPVHSLPLLMIAELGLPGVLIGVGLTLSILRGIRQRPALFSALLIGLLVTSLFDHYLWTLAAGRMLLALAFGLFFAHNPQRAENPIEPRAMMD